MRIPKSDIENVVLYYMYNPIKSIQVQNGEFNDDQFDSIYNIYVNGCKERGEKKIYSKSSFALLSRSIEFLDKSNPCKMTQKNRKIIKIYQDIVGEDLPYKKSYNELTEAEQNKTYSSSGKLKISPPSSNEYSIIKDEAIKAEKAKAIKAEKAEKAKAIKAEAKKIKKAKKEAKKDIEIGKLFLEIANKDLTLEERKELIKTLKNSNNPKYNKYIEILEDNQPKQEDKSYYDKMKEVEIKFIRNEADKLEKSECWVTKKHSDITEKHHCLIISECVYKLPSQDIIESVIHLCPNIHRLIHGVLNLPLEKRSEYLDRNKSYYSEKEWARFKTLLKYHEAVEECLKSSEFTIKNIKHIFNMKSKLSPIV